MSTEDQKASIECFGEITGKLCERWCEPSMFLNEQVDLFISASMIALIDSMPNLHEEQSLEYLKVKNEAIEELEFLSEFLETNCRHNNYGKQL